MNSNNIEKELNKYAKSWIRNIKIKQQVISTKHGKFLKVNNGANVNTHITSILPAKKYECLDSHEIHPITMKKYIAQGYNACRDDCAEAISRANLVVCPTEEEIAQCLLDSMMKESKRNKNRPYHEEGYKFSMYCSCGNCHIALLGAKALLALLHRTAPQDVSNSATQEKR